jgi:hypothetical protein
MLAEIIQLWWRMCARARALVLVHHNMPMGHLATSEQSSDHGLGVAAAEICVNQLICDGEQWSLDHGHAAHGNRPWSYGVHHFAVWELVLPLATITPAACAGGKEVHVRDARRTAAMQQLHWCHVQFRGSAGDGRLDSGCCKYPFVDPRPGKSR